MKYLIPEVVETDRLILRMFRLDDWKDIHEYYGDSECSRYTTGKPLNENESWQKMAAVLGHWQLRNYGSYALEEKKLKRVIGIAGPDYPSDWPEPEIQWGLAKEFWGKGYASEAVRAIKNMTARHMPEISLISLIHPQNINSSNLAKSVGAIFEKEYFFREATWHIYRHV
ncbi:MAG TPA: GNAT family N-acetyltransferase [Chitinophagaceae bacterium]|nr:GNAT family N-acetyltransferase [Chitinophagaceae bacterium]